MSLFSIRLHGNAANKLTATGLLSLITVGCTTFSREGGFSSIEQVASQRFNKEVIWQRSEQDKLVAAQRVKELLESPLTAENAVQIALLNNRGLQSTFYRLGIAESDFVEAGRLPNPGFTFVRTNQGNVVEVDRTLMFNLAKILMMPALRQIEQSRFDQTKREVIMQMLSIVAQTRKAYYLTVAAEQTAWHMQRIKEAIDAQVKLERPGTQKENFSQLQQAIQSFHVEAMLNLAHAKQLQIRSREQLTRLMGLPHTTYALPTGLPDLPNAPEELNDIEQLAMSQRLDVQAAVLNSEQLAKNLGLSKATRFINVLQAGVIHNTATDQPVKNGYQVTLELPLFNWGDAKIAKAEAIYMQSVNQVEEIAINARSEVREAYLIYFSSYDIARYYQDEIAPFKKRISEGDQLQHSNMATDEFMLLADARLQINSVKSSIEALRDFWVAQTDLETSLVGQVH